MEGCCAVEREVDRVLTKFNTTQQGGGVEEKNISSVCLGKTAEEPIKYLNNM